MQNARVEMSTHQGSAYTGTSGYNDTGYNDNLDVTILSLPKLFSHTKLDTTSFSSVDGIVGTIPSTDENENTIESRLAIGSTKIPTTFSGYPIRPGIRLGPGHLATGEAGLLIKDPIRTDPRTRFAHVAHTKL